MDVVQSVRDDLPQRLIGIDSRTILVNVAQLDCLTNGELTAVKRLQADDGLKQGGLSNAVGANNTDDAISRQGEGKSIDQYAISEALSKVRSFDHDVTQTRSRRDLNFFEVKLATAFCFSSHFFVAFQTRLRLRLTSLR